jgi:hypothetical protein
MAAATPTSRSFSPRTAHRSAKVAGATWRSASRSPRRRRHRLPPAPVPVDQGAAASRRRRPRLLDRRDARVGRGVRIPEAPSVRRTRSALDAKELSADPRPRHGHRRVNQERGHSAAQIPWLSASSSDFLLVAWFVNMSGMMCVFTECERRLRRRCRVADRADVVRDVPDRHELRVRPEDRHRLRQVARGRRGQSRPASRAARGPRAGGAAEQ